MRHAVKWFAVLFLLVVPVIAFGQEIPTPEEYLGHRIGAEGEIIDYMKSLEYYRLLADNSDRIIFTELGKTTDGNPFVLLIISSPENLANLDELKAKRDRLSDPRVVDVEEAKRLAAELPAVVFHTGSIHSTEISTAQVPVEVIYSLVSGDCDEVNNILKNCIVLYSPSANPDGQIALNEWYGEHKGQKWEGNMPWLYQSYVGHDDNRDWIMLHFPEQRLTAEKIFLEWHPLYSMEMHEMGSSGARIFVPPYKDPLDSNTAPQVVEAMNMVGMAMSHRLTAEGKGGVVKNAIFDLYTPARAFQVYRGSGRILTETASGSFARTIEIDFNSLGASRYGSPGEYDPKVARWNFPLPWKGGAWSLRDRVDYQVSANFAALSLAATHRYQFNFAYYQALKWAVDGGGWPAAYVIPAEQYDDGALARLLEALERGEIEIHKTAEVFTAGEREFPAGSYVIKLRQPYGAWAKTLLEIQDYPDLRARPTDPPIMPYDVTGHCLALFMNVEAVAVDTLPAVALEPVEKIDIQAEVEKANGAGFALLPQYTDAFAVADGLLDAGIEVFRLKEDLGEGDITLPAGTFIVKNTDAGAALQRAAGSRIFSAKALMELPAADKMVAIHNPRIGIFEPWGGLMDAGWTRLVLEQWGLELTVVRNADVREGNLNDRYDVLIFPEGIGSARLLRGQLDWPKEYQGGISEAGLANLATFVEEGGTIVTFGRTGTEFTKMLKLPVNDATSGVSRQEFFAPGSIVRTELKQGTPLTYGMPDSAAVQFRWCPAFEITGDGASTMSVGTYPQDDPRLSGFLLGAEHIQGKSSLIVHTSGAGRVVMFSFLPQFRGMTEGSYKLLFNAIFWSAEEK